MYLMMWHTQTIYMGKFSILIWNGRFFRSIVPFRPTVGTEGTERNGTMTKKEERENTDPYPPRIFGFPLW